jgi:NAD(P)-dependent dehydrogenase (short-subunit alcohol dehydrogenase family)
LHVLVCNAGVFNMGVRERRETREGGFEEHMACNHLGHFLLAVLLIPSLRAGTKDLEERNRASGGGKTRRRRNDDTESPLIPRARVVSVSSAMHHYGASLGRTPEDRADPQLKHRMALFSADRAYGRSKLAQLLFARELARRTAGEIDSFGLHPGMVVTDVVRSLHPAIGAAYRALMGRLLLSPDEGARASVFAAAATEVFLDESWYLDANARPVAPCAAAECPETAAWLWRWSAEAVGLKEGEDLGVASG